MNIWETRRLLSRTGTLMGTCLALAACGADAPKPTTDTDRQEVEDFAARIGNGTKAPAAPSPAQAEADESAPKNSPAPASEDINPICGSPKVAPFFGRNADDVTRKAVLAAVAPNNDVRFVDAGSDVIPVPASSRLNVMVDAMGVIRDARCG